jgi:hypothetical protein
MDMLGELVVPVLRKEFAALRPAHVPEGPPLHPAVVSARTATDATAVPGTETPAALVAG